MTTEAPSAAAAAPANAPFDENAADPVLRTTHFDFQNKVFKVPKARFFKPENLDEPVMVVDLGDMEGQLRLKNIRKQFSIEDGSHDDELLKTVVKALNFIEDIRNGDKIPNEILDGSSSWMVSPKHKMIARQRLEAQLIGLIEKEMTMVLKTPEELNAFLSLKESKAKLREAFKAAAIGLGLKADDTQAVLMKLELLTREFCYIEALREALNVVPSIVVKLKQVAAKFAGDIRIADTVERVRMLMRKGVNEYQAIFDDLDAQTSDIVTAMRNLDLQIEQIRSKRDRLRYLQMKWTPLVRAWSELIPVQGARVQDLMGRTYRFLATRFDTSKSLMKSRKDQEEAARVAAAKEKADREKAEKEHRDKARKDKLPPAKK
ncbi:MAG: hypothetical protein JNM81_15810 [Rhodospirillaceae bacterium]|nr:hypothetical protein [Rhodospirillaceae bacterium]